ncbi:alkaline phosphatase family protein [Actinoallomurus vinaceus]|uniref:Alkaline phosphatase family protein n=1 Tax=Actinoallomurus vinaceus TaxID=1080074 RepID=A0ABP8UK41_9ACTN
MVAFAMAALSAAGLATVRPAVAATVPRPDHVVIVVMENHSYNDIIGSSSAPYINNTLKAGGANFTQSFAVTHPSQPNYLELFSGSTQGITDDSCPHTFSTENLGHRLIVAGDTFTGYSEDLPSVGYTGCQKGKYYRKHNPWVNFTNVPSSSNVPFSQFPTDYTRLPAVSFVIPNICNDMHDCSVGTGDGWLSAHVNGYAQWAKTHNSVLILTFDEDDHSQNNQIPTIFYGQHVKTGDFAERITHDNVLRTVEDGFTLACVANSCGATPITGIWF